MSETDCVLKEFGNCSYSETGCSDCKVKAKIRNALSAQPEHKREKWNFIGDNMFECTSCGVVYTTEQLNGLRNYDTDPYAPKFCPNCGADMRGKQNEH